MTFWGGSGSGSADPCLWLMDPDPDSDPDSDPDPGSGSCYFRQWTSMPAKNKFFNSIFSAYYFLKLHLHHFSKIKSQKESLNSRNQSFSYYFCMMIEGSGSGSGRPQNTWIRWIRIRIRIRIRNTDIKFIFFCLASRIVYLYTTVQSSKNPEDSITVKSAPPALCFVK